MPSPKRRFVPPGPPIESHHPYLVLNGLEVSQSCPWARLSPRSRVELNITAMGDQAVKWTTGPLFGGTFEVDVAEPTADVDQFRGGLRFMVAFRIDRAPRSRENVEYSFMASAEPHGGSSPGRFRMRIWDEIREDRS